MSKYYYESRIASNREKIRQLNDTIEQKKHCVWNLESLYESVSSSERRVKERISEKKSDYGNMSLSSSRRVSSVTVQLCENLGEVIIGCAFTFSTLKNKIINKINECKEEIKDCHSNIVSCEGDINYCKGQIRAIERREEEERERERQEQWLI